MNLAALVAELVDGEKTAWRRGELLAQLERHPEVVEHRRRADALAALAQLQREGMSLREAVRFLVSTRGYPWPEERLRRWERESREAGRDVSQSADETGVS